MTGQSVEETKIRHGKGIDGISYGTIVLFTVAAAVLLINYVETMVIPGIVDIQHDLNTTETIASWITSSFLIVGAAVAPLFGKLGDVYGKKKMFLIVLGFYIVGVGIAGLADSIWLLLFARAIQGVGFAVLPLAIAMVTDVFPKEKVATAQGIISGTVAIGTTLGLVVGAYVVEDLGWHYAFYTAFALSILLFVAVAFILKKDEPGVKSKMDYTGTVLLMAGISLILIYLTEGPTLGWTSLDNMAFLIPGLLLSIFFFIFESRRTSPLIQLNLLRVRNILLANLVGIVSGTTMFLAFFAVVYYAQLPVPYGLGLDVISTGLALAPATIVMMITGPLVGRIMPRIGPQADHPDGLSGHDNRIHSVRGEQRHQSRSDRGRGHLVRGHDRDDDPHGEHDIRVAAEGQHHGGTGTEQHAEEFGRGYRPRACHDHNVDLHHRPGEECHCAVLGSVRLDIHIRHHPDHRGIRPQLGHKELYVPRRGRWKGMTFGDILNYKK